MFDKSDQNTNGRASNDLLQDDNQIFDVGFEQTKDNQNTDFLMNLIDSKHEEPEESHINPLQDENKFLEATPSLNEK